MSRKDTEPLTVQQKQPPAEAVNLARMLTQSTPQDLEQRIEQVASVVRGRTEDEISIALHDNDYNPDRAVAALLDEDSGNAASEWTTTQRKGKRRPAEGSSEQQPVAAPRQLAEHRPPRRGPRPGPKQYNGDAHDNNDDVVVIEHRPRGRHQGTAPRGKPRTRTERGRGPRGQGFGRPPREGVSRNGRSEVSSKQQVPPAEPAGEELWDDEPVAQVGGAPQGGGANQEDVRVPSLGDGAWNRVGVSDGQLLSVVGPSSSWEESQPGEAGGQWNAVGDHVGVESDPPPAQVSRPRVQFSGVDEKSDRKPRPRGKRSSKTKIPTDAVEMPSDTVDELGIQFGNLGIGFGDSNVNEPLEAAPEESKPTEAVSPVPSPSNQTSKIPSPKPLNEDFPTSLSVSDSPAVFPHVEPRETVTKIDPPPGLSKPTAQQSVQEAMSIASSLPQSRVFASEAMPQQPLMQTPSPAAATHMAAGKLQVFSKSLSPSSSSAAAAAAIGLPTLPSPSQAKMAATVTTHSQASNKSTGPSGMQQQQQQHMMYPPVMPHYMVAPPPPMPYYDNLAYYHHVSTAEYPSMNRDQSLMSFGDTKGRDVGSPSAATQQAQQQGVGMQQGHPYLNYPYPYMYYVPPGMTPFSQQMGPKPNAGGFPGASGNSYPPSSSTFSSYEEMGVDAIYPHRPFGAASQGKAGVTGGESAFKQYDAKGAGFGYNIPPMGGSATAYGYMPSYPATMMPVPPGEGTGVGARQPLQNSKHGRGSFPGSTSWGQGTHTT